VGQNEHVICNCCPTTPLVHIPAPHPVQWISIIRIFLAAYMYPIQNVLNCELMYLMQTHSMQTHSTGDSNATEICSTSPCSTLSLSFPLLFSLPLSLSLTLPYPHSLPSLSPSITCDFCSTPVLRHHT